jgi:hypothetical protein
MRICEIVLCFVFGEDIQLFEIIVLNNEGAKVDFFL